MRIQQRSLVVCLFGIGLFGCDKPSLGFIGSEPRNFNISGYEISVYLAGPRAQAIRTSRIDLNEHPAAKRALRMVLRNELRCDGELLFSGDSAVMNAECI